MRHSNRWVALVMAAGWALSLPGCRADDLANVTPDEPAGIFAPATRVPAGTTLVVRLARAVSSASVGPGDPWRGVTTTRVLAGDRVIVPEGAEVSGTVAAVRKARRGDRAMVHLKVRAVLVDGRNLHLEADSKPVIAASPRVVLREGMVMTFTTSDAVALR